MYDQTDNHKDLKDDGVSVSFIKFDEEVSGADKKSKDSLIDSSALMASSIRTESKH